MNKNFAKCCNLVLGRDKGVDKSILGLMDGLVLSILSQIDVEMNLTPKFVALVVLTKTLNGLDKVKVNRNA